ncbi:hypothetical protein BH23ACI1_BH23ACI1_25810 [soil metagenome]
MRRRRLTSDGSVALRHEWGLRLLDPETGEEAEVRSSR